MRFSQKLDFLMNVTNTTNSALALNIKLDPSHISRLRRGERSALKNESCIAAMASYFARHCGYDYQKKAIAEALGLDCAACGEAGLAQAVAEWLSGEGKSRADEAGSRFLEPTRKKGRAAQPRGRSGSDMEAFFGVEGKRRAVTEFLSEVLESGKAGTLLLFSDEATDWMADDRAFALRWSGLMSRYLSSGGRIKIIHTVSRNLDEMLSAIDQWMPLYMSGAIAPYYYPKKRDGVFKRTLFIAPGVAAVISTSVGNMIDEAANLLFRDNDAVSSFEREFYEYFSLCRPLMRIFTAKDEKAYYEELIRFEKQPCEAIVKTNSISLMTMPEDLRSSAVSRMASSHPGIAACIEERAAIFARQVLTVPFTEIVTLPDIREVLSGGVGMSFCDMLVGKTEAYKAEEYSAHIKNLLYLLERYENFHVRIAPDLREKSYMVYVRDDVGAIVAKTAEPSVALSIGEGNMKAAFWDYLKSIAGGQEATARYREESVRELSEYEAALESAMGAG